MKWQAGETRRVSIGPRENGRYGCVPGARLGRGLVGDVGGGISVSCGVVLSQLGVSAPVVRVLDLSVAVCVLLLWSLKEPLALDGGSRALVVKRMDGRFVGLWRALWRLIEIATVDQRTSR